MPVGAKTFPFTTTVDCIGLRVSRAVPHGPRLTCNAIPVVSRPFTGWWLGSQTRHSLRSLSLQQRCLSSCQPVTDCVFRSPWSARIPALPRESGEVSQPGCRCYVPKRFVATAASVVLALRLGSSFALHSIPNFWLAYIRFSFGQYPKVRFLRFFFIQAHLVQNWDVLKGGMPSEQVDGVPSVSCAD